ncbi:MAG: LTA synthase family protein [Bacilli bacterium]|nr:LTA synthase family protein [Bacilli bacterium]MDD4608301.1 LTA synthase family protein [Bacilli bacterium]
MKKTIDKFISNMKTYMKTSVLFFTFVVTSLLNGLIVRFFTVKNYFAIKPILADLVIILVIGALGYFIKPKKQFKYYFTCSIILTAICLINSIYYTNYLSFTSFSLLATSLQLADVADAVIEDVLEIKDFIYIFAPITLFIVNHNLKKKKYFDYVATIEKGKIRALNTLIVALITLGFFMSMVTGVDLSRLGKQWNREFVVMQFGIYVYQLNDAVASIQPQISPLFGYDNAAKLFREFYENRQPQKTTNDYTDIFKGKNVIFIHAESIQGFLLNKSFNDVPVTPTLNKLAKEGIYFSNFYAQESVGTSSDSEFTINSSLMPASSGTVFVSYWDRQYVATPQLLKEKGYYTFTMHGNKAAFWNRNVMHPLLGFEKYYAYNDAYELDEMFGLGLSDKSFFKQSVPIIKDISEKNKNFMGTLIMLSNHTPFTDIEKISEYEVDYKYEKTNEITGKKEVVSAPYLEGTKMGSYIKSVNYADAAIGEFINGLDESGLLDNTVIVIYGDHDAKLRKSEFTKYYNYDPYTDSVLSKDDENYQEVNFYTYELNRKVPFIIWTKNKKYSTEVTKVMGMYDVAPTLGNMFGFSNPYALGHDIFSINENVVVFPDGNWLTNKMYYNNQKEEGLLLQTDEPVSRDYIDKYNEYAEKIIDVSDAIIVHDLIRKTQESEKVLKQAK